MEAVDKDDIVVLGDDGGDGDDDDDEENPICDVTSLPSSSSSSSLSPIDEDSVSLTIESNSIDTNKTSMVHCGLVDDNDLVGVVSEEEEDNGEDILHVNQIEKEIPQITPVVDDDNRPLDGVAKREVELTQ